MPNLSSFSKLMTIANSVQHNGLFQKRSIPPMEEIYKYLSLPPHTFYTNLRHSLDNSPLPPSLSLGGRNFLCVQGIYLFWNNLIVSALSLEILPRKYWMKKCTFSEIIYILGKVHNITQTMKELVVQR